MGSSVKRGGLGPPLVEGKKYAEILLLLALEDNSICPL